MKLSDTRRNEFVPTLHKNKVHCVEAVNAMSVMKENCVDCIIADPPYNLSGNGGWEWEEKSWDIVNETWDNDSWSKYEKFTRAWMKQASKILRPEGTIWVFGSYHNTPYTNLAIREHGEILNEIVWFKRNAFPNMTGRRFTASHETILWGHLNGDEREYKFNYDVVKENLNCPEDSYTEGGKQMRSVWDIPTNKSKVEQTVDHPTQKPLRVYERIIHAATDTDDTVFIPFAGSGNAALSAKLNNRNYVALEVKAEYAKDAKEYIKRVEEKPDMVDSVYG